MTGARQPRKPTVAGAWVLVCAVLTLCGAVFTPVRAAEPKIVTNPDTGLAISGVDPVAYFTDGRPVFGLPELELSRFGTVWRFRNIGNRAAFLANPDVYMPQFGGHDPVAITRERAVAGHPMIWAINGDRLYLFYDDADRDAFLADPARIIEGANRKWPDVERTLGR